MLATIIPNEALLIDIAQQAAAAGLHIISNGRRTALSPVVPAGWHRLVVKIKTPTRAVLTPEVPEALPCAA